MSESSLPTIDSVKSNKNEGSKISDLTIMVSQILSTLNIKPSEDYSPEEHKFVQHELSKIIAYLIHTDRSPEMYPYLEQLFLEVLNLTIATKLNQCVIMSLIPFYVVDQRYPELFPVTKSTLENVYDFENSTIDPEIPILRPEISEYNQKLTNALFKSSVMHLAISMINQLNLSQIAAISLFFISIQPFLNEKLALSLCIFFARHSIKQIEKDNYNSKFIPQILIFLNTFLPHLSLLLDQMLDMIISIMGTPSEYQFCALKLLISISKNSKIQCNPKIVKKALLQTLQKTTDSQVIKGVYIFITEFSKQVNFTVDDLIILITYIRSYPNEVTKCVYEVIQKVQSPLDSVSCRLLSHGITNSHLGLTLVNRTEDEWLAKAVLYATVSLFNEKTVYQFNNFKISEKIASFISSDLSLPKGEMNLMSLGYFLMSFSRHDLIHDYIMRVCGSYVFEKYESIVKKFANISSRFEGERTLLTLFQILVDDFINRSLTRRTSNLAQVLNEWILNFPSIPETQMLSELVNIDFFKCPKDLPQIISSIMLRSSNRRVIRQVVFKMMKDTVPEIYANWAMNLAFDSVHDEREDIEKIADYLFQAFSDNARRTNALIMIYQGVLIEADFFNVGKKCDLEINAILNGQPFKFNLHPFHSTRRLYVEAGMYYRKPLYEFSLYHKNKRIAIDKPLDAIPFSITKPFKVTAVFSETKLNDHCRLKLQPFFIECIQQPDNFTSLFNQMLYFSSANELIFLILKLVDDETANIVGSSQIQLVYQKEYFMSINDLKSNRLFPYILASTHEINSYNSTEYIPHSFQYLLNAKLDKVSFLIACKLLVEYSTNKSLNLSVSLIKSCLIDTEIVPVREAMASVLSRIEDNTKLLYILSLTTRAKYRSNTKQFFKLLKYKNFDGYLVDPIFTGLSHYEKSFYGPADETFIGLTKLLIPSEKNYNKTFSMLFGSPSVKTPTMPILQTYKSRKAAFSFLLKCELFNEKIEAILGIIPRIPKYFTLNDNLTRCNRGILQPLNLHAAIYFAMYSIKAFRNYFINSHFNNEKLNSLSKLFTEMHFTCAPTVSIKNYELLTKETTVPDIVKGIINRLIYDFGYINQFDFIHIKVGSPNVNFESYMNNINAPCVFIYINRNEFTFPLFYNKYYLTSIVMKSKDEKFSVIYRNDIDESWYIVENNKNLEKFETADIPLKCFGGSKAKFFTFLLVYTSLKDEAPKLLITPKITHQIDNNNMDIWLSVICQSYLFIDFIHDLVENNLDKFVNLAIDGLFKVVILDREKFKAWKELFMNKILINEENCQAFVNYFASYIEMIHVVKFSEAASKFFPELLAIAKRNVLNMPDFTQMIKTFEYITTPQQFGFVCDILTILIPDSNFDVDNFRFLLTVLTNGKTNVPTRSIFKNVLTCFDMLMMKFQNLISEKKCYDLCNDLVQTEFLGLWVDIAEKSSNFNKLLFTILCNDPEIISKDVSEKVYQRLRKNGYPKNFGNSQGQAMLEETNNESLNSTFSLIKESLLSQEFEKRLDMYNKLLLILPSPTKQTTDFIYKRIFNLNNSEIPEFTQETTFCHLIICMLRYIGEIDLQYFDFYFQLIEHLCLISPEGIAMHFECFIELLGIDEKLDHDLFLIIHHILAFDPSKRDSLDDDQIEKITSLRIGNDIAIQVLGYLKPVNGGELAKACIEYCLGSHFTESSEILTSLVTNGMKFYDICEIHRSPEDIMNLKLVNAVFVQNKQNSFMKKYILRLLDLAKPHDIFKSCPCVNEAFRIVSNL